MSEVTTSARGAFARAGAVACSSLLLGVIAMSTAGCLVTSAPQFQAQQHTAPFLVASTALPDTRDIVTFDKSQPMSLPFSANVVSQDDAADSTGQFQKVYSILYIDYGVASAPNQPYLWQIQDGNVLDPGTLEQTKARTVTETWTPNYVVEPGCHTATLTVTHIFDPETHCPVCGSDSSSITWQVLSCDSSIAGNCASLPVTGSGACTVQLDPSKATSCAQVEADAGAVCPDAADAGAP
jgi:hypothetical protein